MAFGLTMLFILSILAGGSRAGMALGIFGLFFGIILTAPDMRLALARYPRWSFPAAITAIAAIILILILISISANRALSFDRLLAIDPAQEMRSRALPLIWKMAQIYFPAGIGFGSFDAIFRIHEPIEFLNPTYFNHAHNDFLEIILDGGLGGSILILTAISWITAKTFNRWRKKSEYYSKLPMLGSCTIFLIIIASLTDYPTRTAMILSVLVIAAFWLSAPIRSSALPPSSREL